MKFGMEFLLKRNDIIVDNRAASVLYRFLINQKNRGSFILPVNICSIVVEVFTIAGFHIEFVDIDKMTLCADINQIQFLLSKKNYSGILLNHTYGCEFDYSETIKQIKSNFDLIIIEDKCLCVPDFINDENVDLTLYSTGYGKMLEMKNGGGYGLVNCLLPFENDNVDNIVLNNHKVLEINSFQKTKNTYLIDIVENIPNVFLHKNRINEIYDYYLSDIALSNTFNKWRYSVIVNNKEMITDKIFENNLFASSHYVPLDKNKQNFPIAHKLFDSVINLFNDHYFTLKQAEDVTKLILKYNN